MIHRTAHILYSYLHTDTIVTVKEVQDPSQNDHTYLLSLVGLSGCGRAPTACHPSIPVRRRSVCSVIPGQKRFVLMRTSPCNNGVSESGDRWFRRADARPSYRDSAFRVRLLGLLESYVHALGVVHFDLRLLEQYNFSEAEELRKLICLWKESVRPRESPSLGHPHHCPMLSSSC